MSWLSKKIDEIKEEARFRAWNRGFDWAAGALLRDEETPMSIDSYASGNDKDRFDMGAYAACKQLIELGIIENDLS
ncbi:MAG: hypothetical protein DRH06_00235 [Deltaproteobacteria bacterium]|nr:MAG: hypothetical protein DRH06_00235 [Deltaproteobacteria bacterium]